MRVGPHATAVYAAPITGWDPRSGWLFTRYCPGINLEVALRNTTGKARCKIIAFLLSFLTASRESGFLWGDAAPRNMLYRQNIIHIVDFERETRVFDSVVPDAAFHRKFLDYYWEEFCAFLTAPERDFLLCELGIGSRELEEPGKALDFKSGRVVALSQAIHGRSCPTESEINQLRRLMVAATIPLRCDRGIFYPAVLLDHVGSVEGPATYAEAARELLDEDVSRRLAVLRDQAFRFGLRDRT